MTRSMSDREAVKALDDLEVALRMGSFYALQQGVFIWAQRKHRILAGEETWADQKFDPLRQPKYVDIDVDAHTADQEDTT